jgi:FkbH-like protein
LKFLKERGVLLAVVSKNEARDVREVFEHHPEMVLRSDDIAAWRVNWNYKSASLREVSAELNLALDSFVFLDDDPAIRAEVEASVPKVHVIPLPPDPTEYCATLGKLWLFDGLKPTEVDLARTRMAHDETARQQERSAATSLEAYLASLELELDISAPTEHDWPRAAQLTQRTNQFNLALKRRTPEELHALGAESSVLLLRARDRFGDYGPVGLGILCPTTDCDVWEIDTFLLSCRALGRGVEDAFLHGLAELASRKGARTLVALYVAGPRNGQVADFLARVGFHETTPDRWERSLASIPPLPGHAALARGDALEPASAG